MTDYEIMIKQADALTEDTEWEISSLANISALIWESLDKINWAGFYIMRNGRLHLGPFEGRVACTVIDIGSGVCGTAAAQDTTQLVYDVHEFPGHIACDSASNSEIVIPVHCRGEIYGVLDIDSPETGRFSEEDRLGLEKLVKVIENMLDETVCGNGEKTRNAQQ
jgi:GAF domain-containing protein